MKCSKVIKRMLSLTLALMLLAMAAAPALAASTPSGAYVVATSKNDKLRVHDAPGGSVVAKLKRGAVVAYKATKSGWWKVEYRGGTGYVDKSYLISVAELPTAKYAPVDNLWVRSKPKADATKLGKLKACKKVTLVSQKGAWVCIKYKGYTGWVPAKYLKCVS